MDPYVLDAIGQMFSKALDKIKSTFLRNFLSIAFIILVITGTALCLVATFYSVWGKYI